MAAERKHQSRAPGREGAQRTRARGIPGQLPEPVCRRHSPGGHLPDPGLEDHPGLHCHHHHTLGLTSPADARRSGSVWRVKPQRIRHLESSCYRK